MEKSLTDTLCTRCGLCCDGSLFADVELAGRAEAARMELMGLEVDDDTRQPLLQLPCLALRGRRCSIYPHRPECCRTFECGLLQNVRRGALDVERAREQIAEALKRIGRMKALIARLGPCDERLPLMERCAEALARDGGEDPDTNRIRAALESAMSEMKDLIRNSFLGGDAEGSRNSRSRPA